jgi:DNA-binding beta-propeller fold protein YncE
MVRWLRLLALAGGLVPLFALTPFGSAASSVASHQLRLAQLAGSAGCVAQPDEEAEGVKGCGRGKALIDASAVALSPDDANVYVAASGSSGAAGFVRDTVSGGLRQNYCISGNGTTGIDGTKGACADGDALGGASGVTVSPDGKFVYATSFWSSGVAVLARNETTGALRQVGCVRAIRTCVSPRAMNGARALALTPDGLNAYVAAAWSDAISEFKRDPATGLLASIGCISDDGTDRLCATGNALRGPDAIIASPDGKQVYVAAEDSNSVLTFNRDPATGILRQRGCIMLDAPARGSCTPTKGLDQPSALALSPDGRMLYATAYGSDAVSVFSRNPTSGALKWLGCESETNIDEETGKQVNDGCGHGRPLQSPTGIAVSPDGNRLYVSLSSGLTVLDRNPTTGTLTVSGCLSYRDYYDEDVVKACQLATGIADPSGVAVSSDGKNVYISSWGSDAISVFAPGPSLSPPRFTAGVLSVRVSCPAERVDACSGRLVVTPDTPLRRLAQSTPFHVVAGSASLVKLRLHNSIVRALKHRAGMAATIAATDAGRTLAPTKRLFALQHRPPPPRPHR